jgi:hypothetical protein
VSANGGAQTVSASITGSTSGKSYGFAAALGSCPASAYSGATLKFTPR